MDLKERVLHVMAYFCSAHAMMLRLARLPPSSEYGRLRIRLLNCEPIGLPTSGLLLIHGRFHAT